MVILSFAWSRKHYAIPYKTVGILLYIAFALVIFYVNKLFLQDVSRLHDLWSGLLLLLFAGTVYLRERSTLNSYKT
jgi:hypothetical protein